MFKFYQIFCVCKDIRLLQDNECYVNYIKEDKDYEAGIPGEGNVDKHYC